MKLAGLFCATLATLMLEVLDTRLLSVITWYHLSFLAVSVAMLGMAAGAVLVYVGGERFSAAKANTALPHYAGMFAGAIALSHVVNVSLPFPVLNSMRIGTLAGIAGEVAVLTLPFVLSGIVVTLALTRTGGSIGKLYAADLLGAAAGCLVVVVLLDKTDISSAAMFTAGFAGLGSLFFSRWRIGELAADEERATATSQRLAVVTLMMFLLAASNVFLPVHIGVRYPKDAGMRPGENIDYQAWNAHSYVAVRKPQTGPPFLWGGSPVAPPETVTLAWAAIDGDAGTAITKWDGRRASLDWVQYDVTTSPYRLRHGKVGVIGVGGGRDLLSALWAGNTSVTGIELNQTFLNILQGPYRDFANIATRPELTLVHDEARSYLTRHQPSFDILQMSLIDTWAATGAGAFTLSENGLYTREGWRVFLGALAPNGVFSVSRWFQPTSLSETTRLVALGTAALLDQGVASPKDHLILITCAHIATLMTSRAPFTGDDRRAIEALATQMQFDIRVSPWGDPADEWLRRISRARSLDELDAVTVHPDFDFSPPTDARPFFFNMLKPSSLLRRGAMVPGGVADGNLMATLTLVVLLGVAIVLVAAIIVWPLLRSGRPTLPPGVFGAALLYFALIGFGFMFIQIPLLQRFSVYLGHPTYTFSIVLFLMILAAGSGSWLSDRLDAAAGAAARLWPAGIAALIVAEIWLLQPAIDRTIGWALPGRTAIVAAFIVPLALALGVCFPIGMRLVGRHSERVTAWMWGVNGACGVLASIVAVMISMWVGISANLVVAAGLYLLLMVPLRKLASSH